MQQKHHDMWNTVQDLCVFVSNQKVFAVSLRQQPIFYNYWTFVNSRALVKDMCENQIVCDVCFCTVFLEITLKICQELNVYILSQNWMLVRDNMSQNCGIIASFPLM